MRPEIPTDFTTWRLKRPTAQWSDYAVTDARTHVVIATVHTLKGEEAAVVDGTLLAAAPDLLSALTAMLERFEHENVHESTRAITDQAHAAIRAARGEA